MSRRGKSGDGALWGIIGGTFGSLCWLVILGIRIRSAFALAVAAAAVGTGGICIFFAAHLLDAYPKRRLSITGISLLWVVVVNLILMNLIYNQIPQQVWDVSTAAAESSRMQLNLLMGGLSILGFWFLVRDIKDV